MVKPDAMQAKHYACQRLSEKFSFLFGTNVQFNEAMCRGFYAEHEGRIIDGGKNLLEDVSIPQMTSGEAYAYVLICEGEATPCYQKHRDEIGPTNLCKGKTGELRYDTMVGQLGCNPELYTDNRITNGLHGSDGYKAVAREITWMLRYLLMTEPMNNSLRQKVEETIFHLYTIYNAE